MLTRLLVRYGLGSAGLTLGLDLRSFPAWATLRFTIASSGDCRSRAPLPIPSSQPRGTAGAGGLSWHNGAARKGRNPFPQHPWCADKEGIEQQPQAPRHPQQWGREQAPWVPPCTRGESAPSRCQRDSLSTGAASPAPGSLPRPRPSADGEQWPATAPGLPRPPHGRAAPGPPRRSPPRPPESLELSPGPRNKRPTPGCRCPHSSRPSRQVPLKHSLPPRSLRIACPGIPGTAPEKSPPPPPLPSRSHLAQLPPTRAPRLPSRVPSAHPAPARERPPPAPEPGRALRCRRLPAPGPRRAQRAASRRPREAPPQRSAAAGGGGYAHARPLRPDAVSPPLASGAAPVREGRSEQRPRLSGCHHGLLHGALHADLPLLAAAGECRGTLRLPGVGRDGRSLSPPPRARRPGARSGADPGAELSLPAAPTARPPRAPAPRPVSLRCDAEWGQSGSVGGGRTGSATRGAPARAAIGAPCLRESGSPALVSLREGVTHSPLVPSGDFPRLIKVEAEGKSEADGAPG